DRHGASRARRDLVRRRVRPGHAQRRDGGPRQAARRAPGDDVPGVGRPPPPRGPARDRQDDAGASAGAVARLLLRPHPVHPGPAALRRDRCDRLRAGPRHVHVPPRADLPQRGPRRRDQPGLAQDAVGAPRGDGGGARHRRRPHPRRGRAVHRDRHAEPHRAGRHLPAARGPARPLPHEEQPRPPGRRVDRGAAGPVEGPGPGRLPGARRDRRGAGADGRARGRGPCGRRDHQLRPPPRRGLPRRTRRTRRAVDAGLPRLDPGGQDVGARRGPRARGAGGRRRPRRAGAGPPAPAQLGSGVRGHDRGRRRGRTADAGAGAARPGV
ncbi:MAG: FIG022979: MoxR-like ATPases, partial [uncultured Nocardioides sp.]